MLVSRRISSVSDKSFHGHRPFALVGLLLAALTSIPSCFLLCDAAIRVCTGGSPHSRTPQSSLLVLGHTHGFSVDFGCFLSVFGSFCAFSGLCVSFMCSWYMPF